MSRNQPSRTIFTDVIEDHLALRARNAGLESAMPLANFLPADDSLPAPVRLTLAAEWDTERVDLWRDVDAWRDAA
jgi:hypothetical protein